MKLNRHALHWKLALLLVVFCLLSISLSDLWRHWYVRHHSRLDSEAQAVLTDYARQADQLVEADNAAILGFLQRLQAEEGIWALILDGHLQPLADIHLDVQQTARLTAMRHLHWPMRLQHENPHLVMIPLPQHEGYFVTELPKRLTPGLYYDWLPAVQYGIPAVLALLFGLGLYRVLIGPLVALRDQSLALRTDRLDSRLDSKLVRRRDEFGELATALDHMAERLQASVLTQRHLLHDLSHELRTPLARLQVAAESYDSCRQLSERTHREVDVMRTLIEETLELAWMDTERPKVELVPVELEMLWSMLCEDAELESGWDSTRFPCRLPAGCAVMGNLNALARVLENLLRNAIRHSPEGGQVSLQARREGGDYLIWIQDQGPGVDEADLQRIFQPFTRLNAARPGQGGFGLGLAIAQRMMQQQGGRIWAENTCPGLRVCLVLQAAEG